MEHTLVASRQIRQIPFKMASFTMESKVHQELSDELDEKVKYVMASVPFNLSLWKVGYDGNVAEGFCELPELPESPEFWSIAYMFLGWNHLFGRIFFAFHFFSVWHPRCSVNWCDSRIVPRSRTPWNSPSWNVLGRWEEIRDFECPVSLGLGRHNLGPATFADVHFWNEACHHFSRLLRWLKRGETCHQPEEVQGVLSSIFVGWLDDWMHKNMWGLIWLDDQPPHW